MADDGKKGIDFKHPGGKEALIGGGVALALALLYFWIKNRNASNAAQNQQNADTNSPTALLLSWIHDHQSSSTPTRPGTVTVPNVVGMTDTGADAAITAAGLKVHDTNERPGGSGGNTKVVSQSPAGGSQAAPGSTVNITLASPARRRVDSG